YCKWYGNHMYIVNWENNGREIKNFRDKKTGRIRSHNYNEDYILNSGITWSAFSSKGVSFRYSSEGFLFDSKGSMAFMKEDFIVNILGYLNSAVGKYFLEFIAGTRDTKPGHIKLLPFILANADNKVLIDE